MPQICRTSFATETGIVQAGTLVADNDPRFKANPAAFENIESRIETATARPGEKRNVVKKTAARKG